MPNPKRRHSKTRTAKRRTHDALKPVPVGVCPQCQEPRRRTRSARTAATTRAGRSARSKRPNERCQPAFALDAPAQN